MIGAGVAGFILANQENNPIIIVIPPGIAFMLFFLWRNILISSGILQGPILPGTVQEGHVMPPGVVEAYPEKETPMGWKIVGLVITLIAIGLIRKCAR